MTSRNWPCNVDLGNYLVNVMNICLYLCSISEAEAGNQDVMDDEEETDGDGFPFNLNDATEPVEV